VLGVPDQLHGEVITALVVLKDGAAAEMGGDGEVAPALRAFCADKLPKYKVCRGDWCWLSRRLAFGAGCVGVASGERAGSRVLCFAAQVDDNSCDLAPPPIPTRRSRGGGVFWTSRCRATPWARSTRRSC